LHFGGFLGAGVRVCEFVIAPGLRGCSGLGHWRRIRRKGARAMQEVVSLEVKRGCYLIQPNFWSMRLRRG
jgi:hypothetical protein